MQERKVSKTKKDKEKISLLRIKKLFITKKAPLCARSRKNGGIIKGGMSSIKTVQQRSKKLNGKRQKDNGQRTVNSKKSKLIDMQKGERYITITFRKIRENPPKLENTKDYFSRFFIFIHKTFICNISKSTSFSPCFSI